MYFRDVYDHAVQVIDTVETLRETGAEMLDVYLSSTTYRMTGVMKVLTIITTIFMPLSLVAGLYGMNFRYMPGLNSPWGFAFVLAGMLTIGIAMIVIFRKKRWI
jgi:magnesium transporter